MMMEETVSCGKSESGVKKRDEWEIREDYHAVKRAMAIFKDKDRLSDVQNMIKSKKKEKDALDSIADGDIKSALGL